jgi:hypothetical protein
MSDLHGLDDPAGDPGVAGDPALPPPPDASLLRDFLQVRALAQHVNVMARLDAFAAAHDAATDEAPDGGGVGVCWGTTDDNEQTGEDSGNSNTVLAGYVQAQAAQSLFQSACGGGDCHSAPSAPPTPPIPYFQQNKGDDSGQLNPAPDNANQDQGCIYCVPGSATPSAANTSVGAITSTNGKRTTGMVETGRKRLLSLRIQKAIVVPAERLNKMR